MSKTAFETLFEAAADELHRQTYGSEPLTTEATRAFTERTGFQPTSEERHMLMSSEPADVVKSLYGEAGDDMEKAARLRQRVDALSAWRSVWRSETPDIPTHNPWDGIEELPDVD